MAVRSQLRARRERQGGEQDARRRLERRRGGAERHGRRDESIMRVKEMRTCQNH